MKYRIEVELDEESVTGYIRAKIYNSFDRLKANIPKRVTIKTFENGKPIFNNIEIKRK